MVSRRSSDIASSHPLLFVHELVTRKRLTTAIDHYHLMFAAVGHDIHGIQALGQLGHARICFVIYNQGGFRCRDPQFRSLQAV